MITVILPVYNEGQKIRLALNAILAQDFQKERLEILIADGMSTDETRTIIREYQQDHKNILLIDNPGKIVPTALNTAMIFARGEIIIRIDGHCIISPDYVSNCVAHIFKDKVDGVGGPMETIGETPLSETIAVAMSSQFGVGDFAFRTTNGYTRYADTVPFPAYTREIIQRVGLYDEDLIRNQDDEYNYRIRELGGKILMASDVKSKYYSRGSLSKLWKQYFQYGFYKVRVLQKHPRQMRLRQFIPLAFVLVLIVSLLAALLFPIGRSLLALVGSSYLLANLIASFLTALKKSWKHLLMLTTMLRDPTP